MNLFIGRHSGAIFSSYCIFNYGNGMSDEFCTDSCCLRAWPLLLHLVEFPLGFGIIRKWRPLKIKFLDLTGSSFMWSVPLFFACHLWTTFKRFCSNKNIRNTRSMIHALIALPYKDILYCQLNQGIFPSTFDDLQATMPIHHNLNTATAKFLLITLINITAAM